MRFMAIVVLALSCLAAPEAAARCPRRGGGLLSRLFPRLRPAPAPMAAPMHFSQAGCSGGACGVPQAFHAPAHVPSGVFVPAAPAGACPTGHCPAR